MSSNTSPLIQITLIYLVIVAIGVAVYGFTPGEQWLKFLSGDVAMTFVTYGFSLWRRNSSVYDAYWSVIPFVFIAQFFWATDGLNWDWTQWGMAAVVSLWSWRLTLNWARSWPGWHHEDWRYVNFRNQFGKHFQWVNFWGIHAYPTAIVFLSCLGLFWVYEPTQNIAGLHIAGLVIAFVGVLFEFFADNQLVAFRRSPDRKTGDVLDTGLWGMVRHPNYLGEMLFWWGLALGGLGAGAHWATLAGATGMTLMFLFASIPMKEKRMHERRPNFTDYCNRVPMLVPFSKGFK